jgi:hypothetical protein
MRLLPFVLILRNMSFSCLGPRAVVAVGLPVAKINRERVTPAPVRQLGTSPKSKASQRRL